MSNTTNFSSKTANVLYSKFIVKQVIKNNYLNDSEASSLYSLIEDNGLTPRKIYEAMFRLTSMTFEDEFATNFSVYNLISAIKDLAYLADFEEYAKRGVYDAKVNYFESSLGKDWRAYLEDEEFINVDAILKY